MGSAPSTRTCRAAPPRGSCAPRSPRPTPPRRRHRSLRPRLVATLPTETGEAPHVAMTVTVLVGVLVGVLADPVRVIVYPESGRPANSTSPCCTPGPAAGAAIQPRPDHD